MKLLIGFVLFIIGIIYWYGKSLAKDEEWQKEKDYWNEFYKKEL